MLERGPHCWMHLENTMRPTYILGSLVVGAACASAHGEVLGGDLVADAGALTPGPPPCNAAELANVDCGTGSKWSELYRDIFGPTNQPGSCSIQSKCHGA